MTYTVSISYPWFSDKLDEELMNFMGPQESSGYGFGERDIQWSVLTKEMAIELAKGLKKDFPILKSISVYHDEEDGRVTDWEYESHSNNN